MTFSITDAEGNVTTLATNSITITAAGGDTAQPAQGPSPEPAAQQAPVEGSSTYEAPGGPEGGDINTPPDVTYEAPSSTTEPVEVIVADADAPAEVVNPGGPRGRFTLVARNADDTTTGPVEVEADSLDQAIPEAFDGDVVAVEVQRAEVV